MLGSGVTRAYLRCWMFLWGEAQAAESPRDSVMDAVTETGREGGKEGLTLTFQLRLEVLPSGMGWRVRTS